MTRHNSIRAAAIGLLAGLSMMLSGCFITPGKFTSQLELKSDNTFTFTYEGEIFFLALSNLAQANAAAETFTPETCYDDDTFEERECTEDELTEQRAQWDAGAEQRAARAQKEAEEMSALMGGIDPSDPEATAELVALLERHKGWNRVEAKGDGLFEVSYSVSGNLTHDFMFPVIEDFPMTNPFVQMVLRDGDVVRVNAPGFSAQNENNPMGGMMGGMAGMAGMAAMSENAGDTGQVPEFPTIEGTFIILTDGEIRANNTDEGPSDTATGQSLTWDISPRTKAAPTALIDLSR